MNQSMKQNKKKQKKESKKIETTICPTCKSDDLFNFENDLFCCKCDWDSTKAFVEAGHLDSYWEKAKHAKHIEQKSSGFGLKPITIERIEDEKAS